MIRSSSNMMQSRKTPKREEREEKGLQDHRDKNSADLRIGAVVNRESIAISALLGNRY